jgi:hypothetical protein
VLGSSGNSALSQPENGPMCDRFEASNRRAFEIILAEGNPNAPAESFDFIQDWDAQTAADEEMFPLNDAGVGLQNASFVSLLDRFV